MYPHTSLIEKLSYTPAELAKVTGLGRGAAYRLARQIGRRHGRRLLVGRDALVAWLSPEQPPPTRSRPGRCTRSRGTP